MCFLRLVGMPDFKPQAIGINNNECLHVQPSSTLEQRLSLDDYYPANQRRKHHRRLRARFRYQTITN